MNPELAALVSQLEAARGALREARDLTGVESIMARKVARTTVNTTCLLKVSSLAAEAETILRGEIQRALGGSK